MWTKVCDSCMVVLDDAAIRCTHCGGYLRGCSQKEINRLMDAEGYGEPGGQCMIDRYRNDELDLKG
jgi:hypothetical protein